MFVRGEVYKRTELHARYGGQRQGGISTPKDRPLIFIFTGESGIKHGYQDYWEDGVFNYYGEGQTGDMKMLRGNRAILQHEVEGKVIHLFRIVRKGWVRYECEATYLTHAERAGEDGEGNPRRALVFQLAVDRRAPETKRVPDLRAKKGPTRNRLWKMSLAKLEALAESGGSDSQTTTRTQKVRKRSEAVKILVRRRADGVCEGCGSPAPFQDRTGRPYLEAHHIYQRADDGPDDPATVIALCPNCHRRVHSGEDGADFNGELAKKMSSLSN
jgi:5-methylcytosine-specific restriction enzyme A